MMRKADVKQKYARENAMFDIVECREVRPADDKVIMRSAPVWFAIVFIVALMMQLAAD